jgi:hypothetical protein
VEALGPVAALQDILLRLAAVAPMVLVEGLEVTAPPGGPELPLTIRLELAGYMRAP